MTCIPNDVGHDIGVEMEDHIIWRHPLNERHDAHMVSVDFDGCSAEGIDG